MQELTKMLNSERQTLLFSATLDSHIKNLAKLALKKPVKIEADRSLSTASNLKQEIIQISTNNLNYREGLLLYVIDKIYKEKVIIFFKTKRECHRLTIILGLLGFKACELHGNLTQNQRIQTFEDFKEKKYDFLLATDLAARGLDIKHVRLIK